MLTHEKPAGFVMAGSNLYTGGRSTWLSNAGFRPAPGMTDLGVPKGTGDRQRLRFPPAGLDPASTGTVIYTLTIAFQGRVHGLRRAGIFQPGRHLRYGRQAFLQKLAELGGGAGLG
jgi:hypothetical protein